MKNVLYVAIHFLSFTVIDDSGVEDEIEAVEKC